MERIYLVETLVKVLFIGSYWLAPGYCTILAVAACFMAVYRRLKTIEFSRAYLERFLQNEYGTNILFIFSFSSTGYSLFFYAPLVLHFLTGIAEYIILAGEAWPTLKRYLGGYALKIKANRQVFLTTKAKIDMVYLPIAVILTLFNFSRLISTVVYVQYILMRSRASREFVEGTAELDNQLTPTLTRFGLGGLYTKLKSLMRSIQTRLGGR